MSAPLVLASWLFATPRAAGIGPVTLRRIRAEDAGALQAFVSRLSPRSRRFRFHGAVNELAEATLDELTQRFRRTRETMGPASGAAIYR